MADSGRISGPVSVLLRSVLKTIATDELNLRQLVQDALLEVLEIFLGGYIETQAFTVIDRFDLKLGQSTMVAILYETKDAAWIISCRLNCHFQRIGSVIVFRERKLAQLFQQDLVVAAENYQALSDEGLKTFNPCLFIRLAVDRTAMKLDTSLLGSPG